MKTFFDLAVGDFGAPVVASWAMRPPLVSEQALIGIVLLSCIVLFWIRSSADIKQGTIDRLYGPGVRTYPRDWWEADLDAIFKRKISKMAKKWTKLRPQRS